GADYPAPPISPFSSRIVAPTSRQQYDRGGLDPTLFHDREDTMGMPLQACEEVLDRAVENLFDADPQIQAVGIGRHETLFGFKAVKNSAKILPASAASKTRKTPRTIKK